MNEQTFAVNIVKILSCSKQNKKNKKYVFFFLVKLSDLGNIRKQSNKT